ncbi:MAG TPA: hypothetical protein VGE07_07025 [Herpetosiphonaceae bacterium]
MDRRPPAPRGAAVGRLTARPATDPARGTRPCGLMSLDQPGQRTSLLLVPADYDPRTPAPLAVLFHGGAGTAAQGLGLLQSHADTHAMLLLAVSARDQTWDLLLAGYGPDVAVLDQALAHVFARYAIDPARIAVGGFSDGASYALSIGLGNGDLFTHILAFSPGFMAPGSLHGAPQIFLTHGIDDQVLPITRCSRRIAYWLRQRRYAVTYLEFAGPHAAPEALRSAAADWFLGR